MEPPTVIPWVPDQMAWQMTTPKNVVRRFAPFASFQKFLVSETTVGNISRQEAVSMIPPLLMDITPGMKVLDLCAAPGSKAAQLIEMVHGGEEARMRTVLNNLKTEQSHQLSPMEGVMINGEEKSVNWDEGGRTTGLLIANDADNKRAHMLIHQMKRLNSPNLIVTNHDATIFPSIKLKSDRGPKEGERGNKYLKFDRILADVPCSGDGTCRKNIKVWKDWNPGNALGLFGTQVRILVRGLQMLKVGGKVVYSTCSMNPVENEAVVAAAIARCGGSSHVNVVDCSESLPQLNRRPGLRTWNIIDKQGNIWRSWSEVEEELARNASDSLRRLAKEMFPSDSSSIPFERCMRVYPHLQDTGAFFIAVLEKRSEIKVRLERENKIVESKASTILNLVSAIEAKPANDTNPIEKIDGLDSIVPPVLHDDAPNFSAASRQNREVDSAGKITVQKREIDAEADAEMATKRLKVREEVDEPALPGTEDREVRWPPPPAAQIDSRFPEIAKPDPKPIDTRARKKPMTNSKPKPTFEEPFKYLSPDHAELRNIYQFYNIAPNFPRDRFMVRNASGNPVRTIYYTSALVRDILIENEGKGIKFVHCGIKMFVSQDVQKAGVCPWRIQSEGLPVLEGWVGEERVVRLHKRETLRKLLVEMFPKVGDEGWKDLGEIGERVRDISMGCCVLRVEKNEQEEGFRYVILIIHVILCPSCLLYCQNWKWLTPVSSNSEDIVLPLWRSLHSLNLMIAKDERRAMLLRLFNDDTPLKDRSKERFAATAAAAKTQKENTNKSPTKSTSTLRGTTAERVKPHYHTAEELADEFPEEAEEEQETEVEGVPVGENAGEEEGGVEVEVKRKKNAGGEKDEGGVEVEMVDVEDIEEGGVNVGGGEGIMRIGGRD